MPVAFINYRRSDAQQAAQALFAQLRARFGPTQAFLDVGAILPGAIWPNRLRDSLDESDVLLCVMGPRWLTAAFEDGRRRLDDPDDWVREELVATIARKKPIIPLLVGGMAAPPLPRALPEEIRPLLDFQALELRDEKWDRDLEELIEILISEHNFVDNEATVDLPTPGVDISPLTAAELDAALSTLKGWQAVESTMPQNYPKPRHELRKVYRFGSFKSAVGFMSAAVPAITELRHHPRWENQWRSVTVYLTTWDIGNRISALDIKTARALDRVFAQWKS